MRFIDVYYQQFIDELETDFESIPDDPYYRDQITFYSNLLIEIEESKRNQLIVNALNQILAAWQRYPLSSDMTTSIKNRYNYFVLD